MSFEDGLLFTRLERLVDGKIPAVSLFSAPYYAAEQLGFRKICETSFMMATMIDGTPDEGDVRKYFRALKRAQADIDLRPERHAKHYLKELSQRLHDLVDVRRFGPGERIVFESYSRDVFNDSRQWIAERGIFEDGELGSGDYDSSILSLTI